MANEQICFDKENGYYLENLIRDGANELRKNLGCHWSARAIEDNIEKMGNAWVAYEALQEWIKDLKKTQIGGAGDQIATFLIQEIQNRTGVKIDTKK